MRIIYTNLFCRGRGRTDDSLLFKCRGEQSCRAALSLSQSLDQTKCTHISAFNPTCLNGMALQCCHVLSIHSRPSQDKRIELYSLLIIPSMAVYFTPVCNEIRSSARYLRIIYMEDGKEAIQYSNSVSLPCTHNCKP